jgi:dTMP kinase
MQTSKGKFIVIDGTDGTGKGTQSELLVKRLQKAGKKVKLFDFPQYGKKSAGLVEEYLNGVFGELKDVDPYVAATFYAVDRYAASKELRELLNQGYYIISNRYTSASMGHQASNIANGKEREKFLDWLYDFEFNIFKIPQPDVVVLLHLEPQKARLRVDNKGQRNYLQGKKRDILEEDLIHQVKAYECYLDVAKKYNWIMVDTDKGIEDVHNDIWEKISHLVD